jgi:hypothetical protein
MLNGVGDVSVKDFLSQMTFLKHQGYKENIIFHTSDTLELEQADCVIFIDCPEESSVFFKSVVEKNIDAKLMVWESGIINPRNLDKKFHNHFSTVFTYDDNVIDNKKYIKLCYSFEFPDKIANTEFDSKKLCCLISGNKYSEHPLELYSKRLEVIDWFEKNKPSSFDLYGQGWDKIIPPRNILHRLINKFPYLSIVKGSKYKTYRGEVGSKIKIYSQYRFALCFENAFGLTGYVSEKIFDCLFSGCVPIYLGADNIAEHIPSDCFIDMRGFKSVDELFDFINNVSGSQYMSFQDAINKFLETEKNGVFSLDYFSSTIIGELKK